MYYCSDSRVLGSYLIVLLRVSIGEVKVLEERITVGLAPGRAPVASMDNSNYIRGRV